MTTSNIEPTYASIWFTYMIVNKLMHEYHHQYNTVEIANQKQQSFGDSIICNYMYQYVHQNY